MKDVFRAVATEEELTEKTRIYNEAAAPVWQLTVYEPVHKGWEFTNIGGQQVLDEIGRLGNLDSRKNVLELCCGLGATCRYMVNRFGCKVTGIDINPFQIDYARARLGGSDNSIKERINFVLCNIVYWQPAMLYDVVFAIDSMTMIDKPRQIMEKASRCLQPKGMLALAEVMAGKNINNEIRRYVWEMDGFINLSSPKEYQKMLSRTGFLDVNIGDMTSLAESCFDTTYHAVRDRKEEIVDLCGPDAYESWVQISEFYRRCFKERSLVYNFITCLR